MEKETIIIAGAAVAVIGIVGFLCYKAISKASQNVNLTDVINENADEQLVVDKLTGVDLTPWFKEKNAGSKYTNAILYPTEQNIKKFNILNGVKLNDGHLLIQMLFDESTQKMILMRSVVFEEMDKSLSDMLEKNDGIIFIK